MLHELDLQYIYNRHLIMSNQGHSAVFSTTAQYELNGLAFHGFLRRMEVLKV